MPKKGEKAITEGRKDNQKMRPYLVYQYLLHNSYENHVIAADDIVAYYRRKGHHRRTQVHLQRYQSNK